MQIIINFEIALSALHLLNIKSLKFYMFHKGICKVYKQNDYKNDYKFVET